MLTSFSSDVVLEVCTLLSIQFTVTVLADAFLFEIISPSKTVVVLEGTVYKVTTDVVTSMYFEFLNVFAILFTPSGYFPHCYN